MDPWNTKAERKSTMITDIMEQKKASERRRVLAQIPDRDIGTLQLTTYDAFCTWAEALGFQPGRISHFHSKSKMINLAYNLMGHYDLGVGIAIGGLEPAYFFSMFGLEVLVCECHKGRDFYWAQEPSKEYLRQHIAGKRVVVIDEDIVYGRNSRRVVNEIMKYRPQQADLALVHHPLNENMSVDRVVASASPKFGKVVTPADFGYKEFDKAIRILKRAVRHSTGAEARL